MRLFTLIFILSIFIQGIFPTLAFASMEQETATGSIYILNESESGSVVNFEYIHTGSVLHENEIIELENSSNISNTTPTPIPSPLSVRISEVAWMGSDLSTADEWIEMTAYPTLTGSVVTEVMNLRGWSLSIQKDIGETVIATISNDLFMGSGEYLVLANSAASSSRLVKEPAIVSTTMSIPNTKLQLRLRDADGVLIDEVDDYVGSPFAGVNSSSTSGLPKATMERIDLRGSGIDKANWTSAVTSRGLDVGTKMLGTPGYANGSIEPPDITPPANLLNVQAFALSGSLLMSWSLPPAFDASILRLQVGQQIIDFPSTATGVVLPLSLVDSIRVVSIDAAGNVSSGVEKAIVSLHGLFISELLPDPQVGGEEWIEVVNTSDQPLDLLGFTLRLGSKRYNLQGFLLPSTSLYFGASQTGLSLPNAGGFVQLFFQGILIDQILYTELPDGVSIGRGEDRLVQPYCVPTPGTFNMVRAPTVFVDGFLRDQPNPTSLNLEVIAQSGSIAGGSCRIDYGDGFVSQSCNPPSHSMKKSGHLVLQTTVQDFCGTTLIQEDPLQILLGSVSKQSSVRSQLACKPTATDGMIISEFLPSPASGAEEWIELQNTTQDTINLCGWSVDDAVGGSSAYRLDDISVEPGQYLILRSGETKIILNNDADTVRLIAPSTLGGTGVLLSIPFQNATTDQSFAIRDDGVMLETEFPTPGSENRFASVDTTPGSSPVIISAAMPNPIGVDEWDEWIELTNMTGRPQWLNGWHIEDNAGHRLSLDGRVLAKREVQRIALYKTNFTLGNTNNDLRLIDEEGIIRSVLAWQGANEGKRVKLPEDCTEQLFDHLTMVDVLTVRAKTASGETVRLAIGGVQDIQQIFEDKSLNYINGNNYLSALLKNKILVYKNCSQGVFQALSIEGADLALLLLQSGYAVADPTDTSARREEFLVYEREARKQRRGIWTNIDNGLVVDAWKANNLLDTIVARDGLQITVTPDSGLLSTGAVISVQTNIPADLWVKQGTGPYRRFDGGVFIHDRSLVSFLASYTYKTLSGGTVHTARSSHTYDIVRSSYPVCLRINEVYPSPKKGEHEWVELQNTCDEDVSLLGWTIDDMENDGSKPFAYKNNQFVPAGGMFILSGALLPIALNNGGDSVVVLSPDKRIQDAMTYGKVAKGKSVAFVRYIYCQTTKPTIGMNNICIQSTTKAKAKTGKGRVAKTLIGLGTKYGAILVDQNVMNTENDQFKGLIEGLNRNSISIDSDIDFLSLFAAFLFSVGLVSLGFGIVMYGRRYRLFQ